tara:strand:- start:3 stop:218 length:216 start_codon:yes stop_codon:yes gene_type:complete
MTPMDKIDWDMIPLTKDEQECIRVCLSNAPIPYDIRFKKIPKQLLEKMGEPTPLHGEPLPLIECDLTKYEK